MDSEVSTTKNIMINDKNIFRRAIDLPKYLATYTTIYGAQEVALAVIG